MEVFLKKSEGPFKEKIGEEKTRIIFENLKSSIKEIPNEISGDLGSDIPKFLFQISLGIDDIEEGNVEAVLNYILFFTQTLSDLEDKNRKQVNQIIINRSNNKMRSLLDLLEGFVEKAKEGKKLEPKIKNKSLNFEDILAHTLGTYISPKRMEEASLIHEIMAEYRDVFPIVKEHAKWAILLLDIIPRFLEILQSDKGDKLIEHIWKNSLSENKLIEGFREKLAILPRNVESLFLRKLLDILDWQILIDENLDRALTGSVAHKILSKFFTDMSEGRNSLLRAVKLKKLIKERESANETRDNDIDYQIEKIVEEDFKSIQNNIEVIIKTFSIAYTKRYFIKIVDLNLDDCPKEIAKIFSARNYLKFIGKDYLDSSAYGKMVNILKGFHDKLDMANNFNKKFLNETLNIPQDAKEEVEILKKFFDILLELSEYMEPNKFYANLIAPSEHLLYVLIINYLYHPSMEVFNAIQNIVEQEKGGMKIISMARFLSEENLENNEKQTETLKKEIEKKTLTGFSENSERMIWLNSSLEQRKNDKKKFLLMNTLLNESKKALELLESRLEFSKRFLTISNTIKKLHLNLPAAFPKYLKNIKKFNREIDNFYREIDEAYKNGFITSEEFQNREDAALVSKDQISELFSDKSFNVQIKALLKIANEKKLL